MNKDSDKALREHVSYLLRGGGAHIEFRTALDEMPLDLINVRVGNLPYTPWQVLEHMRIAQWDILEFSRNEKHVSPPFPKGYWPEPSVEADEVAWRATVSAFFVDLDQMDQLVLNPATDLFAPIPHGDGQTILREALLVADHNAYHLGSIMTMRKMKTG
jgi:DinB superfamily